MGSRSQPDESSLDRTPIFEELADAQRILIAGAGGGFDVFSGLPLYFRLREMGKDVHLSNLSFSRLGEAKGRRLAHGLIEVNADSEGMDAYFPEKHLSAWFRARGEEVPVWCFPRLGGKPMTEAHTELAAELDIDAIVLVDGGTDSLMRGDEEELGTPYEDSSSIAAVDELDVRIKLLICVGFGIDAHHGVCHAHFLEGVAETARAGGFLGVHSLLPTMPEVQLYREAVQATFDKMPTRPSVICSSVISAIDGHYGDHHATERTHGSELWINPLMSLVWCFRLAAVADRCLYLDEVKQTEYLSDIATVIHKKRLAIGRVRPWRSIPV